MWVRGSFVPPASPLRKGPQPWSTASKSSYTVVPGLPAGSLATIRTSSIRTAAALPPAASILRGVAPCGAVKVTLARWRRVSFQSEAAIRFWSGERSTVTDAPPAERVVGRVLPGSTSIRAEAVYRLPGVRPVIRCPTEAGAVPVSFALVRPCSSVSRATVPVFVQAVSPASLKPGSFTGVPRPHWGSVRAGALSG